MRIKKYDQQGDYFYERPLASDRSAVPTHSVWDYITKHNAGATYEVTTNINGTSQNAPSSVDAAFNQFSRVN